MSIYLYSLNTQSSLSKRCMYSKVPLFYRRGIEAKCECRSAIYSSATILSGCNFFANI